MIGVIGYRVFHAGGSGAATTPTATVTLPKGARVICDHRGRRPHRGDDRIGGAIEVRTFDLKTLQPTGRLRFATEP